MIQQRPDSTTEIFKATLRAIALPNQNSREPTSFKKILPLHLVAQTFLSRLSISKQFLLDL